VGDNGEPRFLRSNVIFEPLVDRFYAWLHNVAPVQAAMNMAFVQIPMLEAYLQSPQDHISASANPDFRGGYFVAIEEHRSSEVGLLVDSIKRDRSTMLAFAAAIADGEELLRREATGFDLSPLYPKLPTALHGLVELVYDTNNHASLRFLESLVYGSGVFDPGRQSVQLTLDHGAERPFVLSTPRLPSPDALDLPTVFGHPGLERLASSRIRPASLARLREALELDDFQAAQLDRLLDTGPSHAPDRHIEAGARIRYFGHACLVLQTPQAAIVTDPFISTYNQLGDRYTLDDLPDHIDAVVITHGHQDHLVLETLMQLRGRVDTVVVPRSSRGNLCDPSIARFLAQLGMPVTEVDDFDEVPVPGGKIIATPFLGEHCDLDIRGKSTYWIELAGKSVFVGADSSGIDPVLYRNIRSHLGRANLAFLGMECDGAPLNWLYKGLLTKPVSTQMSRTRKLSGSNAAQAADIVSELGAEEAYVYAMGEERWVGHVMATTYKEDTYQMKQIDEFLGWCADRGLTAEHLFNRREWHW